MIRSNELPRAEEDYIDLCTGQQLSFPWDVYTDLIDNIPVNYRNARVNEKLLHKSQKQKSTSSKLLQVGYRLGKL